MSRLKTKRRYVLRKKHRKRKRRKHLKLPAYTMRPSGPLNPPVDPNSTDAPAQLAFGHAQAERLLWRAGFGPKAGDAERFATMGLDAAVAELLDPPAAQLVGPNPVTEDGDPLAPEDLWGHAHCWWLDRMIRSNQPLVERMTLVWHDWFATSQDKVGSWSLMLAQNELFRTQGLGSFKDLLVNVTKDPAMLVWLDSIYNTKYDPNENYGREIMELFTLGADRGAYSEDDVREIARAFTGWTADWDDPQGWNNFRFVNARHDTTNKTVFGRTGNWSWQDGCTLCLENQFHASFFVTKLWSYFIPTPPDAGTQGAMQAAYLNSGYGIKPVLEIILKHPDLYTGGSMVKPPIVYTAGLLRAIGRGVDTTAWAWLDDRAGQFLFFPPNVAGWDDGRWLDTSSWRGRWDIAVYVLDDHAIVDPWDDAHPYSTTEDAPTALATALAAIGDPHLTDETRAALAQFSAAAVPATGLANWQKGPVRAMRQNALRMLALTSSDVQTS